MTYEDALMELAQQDPDLMILTAENRAAIRNLPPILGKRFVDFGICEQTMVGAAAGLALRGRVPVVHALATFLTMRAYEFIRTDTAIPGLRVKFVGSYAGFLSEANGPTHQALEDISLMRSIPGMGIFCPSDEDEMIQGLPEILSNSSPYYIRFNPTKTRLQHTSVFKAGIAEQIFNGSDACVLTYGLLVQKAVDAHQLLKDCGLEIRVLNLRTLRPIDEAAILTAAQETQLLFTLEDHFKTGGLYSIVCELLIRSQICCRVIPLCMEDRWFQPALLDDVLLYHGFTGKQLATQILNKL